MVRASPRVRIEAACQTWGRAEVVRRCDAMLLGAHESPEFILVLGGEPARRLVAGGIPQAQAYWLRVWAARGLLWAGPAPSHDGLRAALGDAAWRVREMACKVVARHAIEDLLEDVVALESDPVPRVRQAAQRAAVHIIGRSS